MNNIIFLLKLTLLSIVLLAKYRFYRPFTNPKVQNGPYYRLRSLNTDPLGNPDNVKTRLVDLEKLCWLKQY